MKTLSVILSVIIGIGLMSSFLPSTQKSKAAYTLHGYGDKKVIVLHSWMDDYQSWSPVIPHLDKKSYTYAFMDVRGYGKSINVKGDFTSDEIANDIFDVADNLGWDQFYLVGHSMTGMAAQKAALKDKKNRIIKVVAITPVASAGFPVDDENLSFFKAIVQNKETAKMAFGVFTSNRLSGTWYDNRATRHIEATNETAQLAYIDMWVKENFQEKMAKVQTPFLVMWGQYDHPGFLLEAQKKDFENIRNVEFLKIENSGHFPMQETPIFLAASIENFLN